jgi:hypothetical protein
MKPAQSAFVREVIEASTGGLYFSMAPCRLRLDSINRDYQKLTQNTLSRFIRGC